MYWSTGIQRSANSQFLALASRDAAKLAEARSRFGVTRLYPGYGELLRDPEVDAVYIPLPNALHREWTIRAAEHGKHVLCEKPLALTAAEGRVAGEGDATRATLHRSMVAYAGRYRVAGEEFITSVEIAWNEAWKGTQQRRRFRIEGERLVIESAPGPSLFFPGQLEVRRLVWQREP